VVVTGIVATMPYIALQLVGVRVVIKGVSGELPLIVAFVWFIRRRKRTARAIALVRFRPWCTASWSGQGCRKPIVYRVGSFMTFRLHLCHQASNGRRAG
jgi:hypothetical protein